MLPFVTRHKRMWSYNGHLMVMPRHINHNHLCSTLKATSTSSLSFFLYHVITENFPFMSLDGSVVALNKSHRPSKPASRFLSPECLSHSRQKTLTRQKTNTKLLCFFRAPAQMLKKGVTEKQTPPQKKIGQCGG